MVVCVCERERERERHTHTQYSMYGHHGRGDEETEEGVVRGSEDEGKKERITEQETEQESVLDWLLLVGES